MQQDKNPFRPYNEKNKTVDGVFSQTEVGLANRNHGFLLEALELDVTPTGTHYLLNHFDVPFIKEEDHRLEFAGAFENPMNLSMADIRKLPKVTLPVTMECAGNGRAGVMPRSFSMPWMYEAVGTSMWTGTPLAPLIAQACPKADVVDISFTGADYGFDMGEGHYFGRSLTLQQLDELDVLLVYEMNGAPLLPQHGAPLRIIVPGWYGMASVKWLTTIEALTKPYDGFQQVRTYRFRKSSDDEGTPIQDMRVKSLMKPPGVPDWTSRKRYLKAGSVELTGRAWSGLGRTITKVEVGVDGNWQTAELVKAEPIGDGADLRRNSYGWTRWSFVWQAEPGEHLLQCRATDAEGNIQPLEPPFDVGGFANNCVHSVSVFVD